MSEYASIEDAMKVTRGLDPREIVRTHGRLMLSSEGLFFVHGWDEMQDASGGTGGALGGAVGAVAAKLVADQVGGGKQAKDAGLQMLAEVQHLQPPEQVERVAGSVHIPVDDIEKVKMGFLGRLDITTESRGDKHSFIVQGQGKRAAKAWVKVVARR